MKGITVAVLTTEALLLLLGVVLFGWLVELLAAGFEGRSDPSGRERAQFYGLLFLYFGPMILALLASVVALVAAPRTPLGRSLALGSLFCGAVCQGALVYNVIDLGLPGNLGEALITLFIRTGAVLAAAAYSTVVPGAFDGTSPR